MNGLSKSEILEMIASHKITSQEGFELISKSTGEKLGTNLVYTQYNWNEVENILNLPISYSNRTIVIFSKSNQLNEIFKNDEQSVVNHQIITSHAQQQEDYERLFEDLKAQGIEEFNILYSWDKIVDNSEFTKQNIEEVFYLCKALTKIKLKEYVQLVIFYRDENGNVPVDFEALGGFSKSIRLENPKIGLKTVQVGEGISQNKIIDIIYTEFNKICFDDVQVKYSSDKRYIKQINTCKLDLGSNNKKVLKQNGVYLITGGLGALGFKFATYLAEKFKAQVILLGRTELNSKRKIQLDMLEKLGAKVSYEVADITNSEDIEKLLKRYTHIDGIIHSAGIIKDSMLTYKTYAEFEQVIAAKVKGTLYLYEAMKSGNIDIMVLFSSMAAVIGNVGQSDYAYANGFMDALANKSVNKLSYGKIISINWPLWEKGGMSVTDDVKVMMKKKLGVNLLSDKVGLTAFEDILSSGISQIMVLDGQQEEIVEKLGINRVREYKQERIIVSNSLSEQEEEKLIKSTQDYLRKLIAEVTKIPYEDIGIYESFEMYGMDSITAMRINDELEGNFGELSKTLMFEYQNVDEFAKYFVENFREKLMKLFGIEIISTETKQSVIKPMEEVKEKVTSQEVRVSQSQDKKCVQQIDKNGRDIAIIGLSGKYPKANNVNAFWKNLVDGVDCIIEIPKERWDHTPYYYQERGILGKTNSKWGGFLDDMDKFDPLFFNISPREAHLMDPQERLFLQTSWGALEDAGYAKNAFNQKKVGVFVGVMYGQYQMLPSEVDGQILAHTSIYASIANRVSYYLNLSGPSMAIDTMCSSSLTAIHLACDSIRKGESDMAIAGGVNVTLHPDKYLFLSQGNFLSGDGKCRGFGEGGEGYVPSEGVGAVVLKLLEDAIRDQDYIYGVIKSSEINHGGKTSGYTVPNPNAQAKVIQESLRKGDVLPSTINYVEAHGTGTALGDPIEITGLMKAYGKEAQQKQYCSIGSVKSNIGHAESAAGIASLTKVLLQLKHKKLVPSIHTEELNKNINFQETFFKVQTKLEDWQNLIVVKDGIEVKLPRRAGISCFGAGGANAHLIVEEYVKPNEVVDDKEYTVFLALSAKNEERIGVYANQLLTFMREVEHDKDIRLVDIAFTLQKCREAMKTRLAIVAKDKTEFIQRLESFCQDRREAEGIFYKDTKKGQSDEEFLLDGVEGKTFVESIVAQGKVEKLAKIWVIGHTLNCDELYVNIPHKKIPLPTYPFIKDRYWIPQTSENPTIRKIHPLLDENISDKDGFKFQTKVSTTCRDLKDYYFKQDEIFSLFALVEMMYEGAEYIEHTKHHMTKQIVFASPLSKMSQEMVLETRVYPCKSGVMCEVANEKNEILAQSQVVISQVDDFNNEVEKMLIKKELVKSGDNENLYSSIRELGLNDTKLRRSLKGYSSDLNNLLIELTLEDANEDYFDSRLLELILQVYNHFIGEKCLYLPCTIENIVLRKPITKRCSVYISQTYRDALNRRCNIIVLNEEEEVALVIQEMALHTMIEKEKVEQKANQEQVVKELLNQLEIGKVSLEEVITYMEESK